MALIKRLDKGSPITAVEMDANLQYLEDSINAGTSGTSGSSGSSGSSGTRGTSGSSGSSGSSGTSGAGTSGSSGTSGAGTSGSSGSSGTSGAGTSGTSGTSGAGTSGSSGTSGAGTSGTSGTSLALSLFDGDLTRLSGIRNITLSGLSLNPSGSAGATITNLGGGGGGSTINVASGSTTISSVSTLRVDASTMTLTNNGAGTVTIGVTGSIGGGGTSGTAGSGGTSGNSLALTLRKGGLSLSSIENITLSGSIFLDNSGSNGAFLRVDTGDTTPIIVNGFVSSSQQIVAYDVFAVKNAGNSFTGLQNVTGSIISSGTVTTADLFVQNSINSAVPEGNVIIGISGSRAGFLPTSSLTATAAISVFGGVTPYSNINTVKFSNDFLIQTSGSGVVVVSSVTGSGATVSGSGFPFSGSAVITGSLEVTGSVTASAFAITSVGVPTIESATNLNLTAGGTVVVSSSPIRLATFTDAQTGSITAVNGDMIYNSTTHKFMGYASGSWVQLH